MSDIALNNDGDLLYNGTDLQLVAGADYIAQTIQIKIATFLGEWFADTTRGIDYKTFLSTKPAQLAELDSALKIEIQDTPGVLPAPNGIEKFVVNFDSKTRTMSVTADINTDDGFIALDIAGINIGLGGGLPATNVPVTNETQFFINFEQLNGW